MESNAMQVLRQLCSVWTTVVQLVDAISSREYSNLNMALRAEDVTGLRGWKLIHERRYTGSCSVLRTAQASSRGRYIGSPAYVAPNDVS